MTCDERMCDRVQVCVAPQYFAGGVICSIGQFYFMQVINESGVPAITLDVFPTILRMKEFRADETKGMT